MYLVHPSVCNSRVSKTTAHSMMRDLTQIFQIPRMAWTLRFYWKSPRYSTMGIPWGSTKPSTGDGTLVNIKVLSLNKVIFGLKIPYEAEAPSPSGGVQ